VAITPNLDTIGGEFLLPRFGEGFERIFGRHIGTPFAGRTVRLADVIGVGQVEAFDADFVGMARAATSLRLGRQRRHV